MSVHSGRSRRRAFTLTELIVVITVLAILALILIPVIARVRSSAQSTHCVSNLQQIGRAFTLYAQDHRSCLPPAVDTADGNTPWFVAIHSYTGTPWRGDMAQLGRVFLCPTWELNETNQPTETNIGYSMSAMLSTGIEPTRVVSLGNIQQPSRSVLVLERSSAESRFFPGLGEDRDTFATTYAAALGVEGCDRHAGSANYLFVDGHVGRHGPHEVAGFLK